MAMMVGGCLGLAGAEMQTVLNNPLWPMVISDRVQANPATKSSQSAYHTSANAKPQPPHQPSAKMQDEALVES